MTVSVEDLERSLARVRRGVDDPRVGLYGPGSVTWAVSRESVTMLGGGAAALLQLAHPHVAYAIAQHSRTVEDPLGRFARTFEHVFAMTFGSLDDALASARRVHAVHRVIRGRLPDDAAVRPGEPYLANAPSALLWVHATLLDTAVKVYELAVGPLCALEREAYYAESTRFAHLFGIDDAVLPPSWEAFEAYYRAQLAGPALAVSAPARRMRRFLFHPATPLHRPVMAWLEAFSAGLLPPRLRAAFGLRFGAAERALVRASRPALRLAVRAAPPRLRYFSAYLDARRRLTGRPPDHLAAWIERAALASLRPTEPRDQSSARTRSTEPT